MTTEHDPWSKNLARATVAGVGITATPKDDATPEQRAEAERLIAVAEEYFSHFAMPPEDRGNMAMGAPCICCGEPLTGFLGTFTWGLVHGEGRCGKCGWPARGVHYVKDKDGKEIFVFRNVLQYHPDEVERRKFAQRAKV